MSEEWDRVYGTVNGWAFKWRDGMRVKDLPPDIRIALEPHLGALEPLRFKAGKLYYVTWSKLHPNYWPDATENLVEDGDYLFETRDYGIALLKNSVNVAS